MKRVTMTQIAKELGVSRSLVSYALMDKYGVSEEMKRRIITKAVEMGYFKTPHASLKSNKNFAVIIGEDFLGEESFFTRIIAGIENLAVEKKFVPKIMSLKDGENIERFLEGVIDLKPWGMIVIRQLDEEFSSYFQKLDIPKVFVDLISVNQNCFEVRVNNYGNMYRMTKYLIDCGHDDLLFVGDIEWALSFDERYRGFLKACKEAGVRHTEIVTPSGRDLPYDCDAFERFVRERTDVAIVCASDSIAANAYLSIKGAGKRIPEDFSVVGFDDVAFGKKLSPPLTTMHIPRFELGRVAFGLLHEQISYYDAQSRVICLNANLVERRSVKIKKEEFDETV